MGRREGRWAGGWAELACHSGPCLSLSEDLLEVSLADNVELGPAALENSTAQQIMQLLCEMQSCQEHPGLSKNPCVPFFYRADDNAGVKIMVI